MKAVNRSQLLSPSHMFLNLFLIGYILYIMNSLYHISFIIKYRIKVNVVKFFIVVLPVFQKQPSFSLFAFSRKHTGHKVSASAIL